jgi:AbrB family looped-hinge helix DNA binding protein
MGAAITMSPRLQITIPKPIRARLRLRPGRKLQAIACDDRITLIPVRRLKEMRGFLRGIDTRVARERDRANNAYPTDAIKAGEQIWTRSR